MTSPTTPAEILTRLRKLSKEMQTLGAAMSYYGGFDVVMTQRGGELFGAGRVVKDWVEAMDDKQ